MLINPEQSIRVDLELKTKQALVKERHEDTQWCQFAAKIKHPLPIFPLVRLHSEKYERRRLFESFS